MHKNKSCVPYFVPHALGGQARTLTYFRCLFNTACNKVYSKYAQCSLDCAKQDAIRIRSERATQMAAASAVRSCKDIQEHAQVTMENFLWLQRRNARNTGMQQHRADVERLERGTKVARGQVLYGSILLHAGMPSIEPRYPLNFSVVAGARSSRSFKGLTVLAVAIRGTFIITP